MFKLRSYAKILCLLEKLNNIEILFAREKLNSSPPDTRQPTQHSMIKNKLGMSSAMHRQGGIFPSLPKIFGAAATKIFIEYPFAFYTLSFLMAIIKRN